MKNLIVCSTFSLIFASGQIMGLGVKRTLKAISEHELKVEIKINKGDLSDFASLKERIPAGSELNYARAEGGTFQIDDHSMNYVWTKLPKQDQIILTYTVNTQNLKEGIYSINGKFTCKENGLLKDYEIETSGFVVNENSSVSPDEDTESATPMIIETRVDNATSTHASKTLAAVTGVTFGLQLLSTKEKLTPDYFSKKYNVKESVKMYSADGLNKYVMGQFKTRQQAQQLREILIKNGCKDAFLVAYENNQRISLEQANRK